MSKQKNFHRQKSSVAPERSEETNLIPFSPSDKTASASETPPVPLSDEEKDKWQTLINTISEKSTSLWHIYASKPFQSPSPEGPTVFLPSVMMDAFLKATGKLLENPELLFTSQQTLLSQHALLTQQFLSPGKTNETPVELVKPQAKDNRFKHPSWQENPYFNYVKQAYLLNSNWIQNLVNRIDGLDHKTSQKLSFYTKQWLDALSPTNFPLTNPEVVDKTRETKGENLLNGIANLLRDLERGGGRLSIPKTNLTHFKVGHNIAATPGKVIFQNDVMQLIHYEPVHAESYATPLVIVPPWINKFYVFDLNKNSFIRAALDAGHSVFIISWVNPDGFLAHKTFEDYMKEGPLCALDQALQATGASQANFVSYCLGGILLSCTLGYMAAHNDHRAASATFFATLVDFSNPGELSVFIDDDQLDFLEKRMRESGFLDSYTMSESFNLLRANSLIWSAYINNYLLAKEFAPFDMLFWNSDGTRMPPRVYSYYLRNLYQKNLLIKEGELLLAGTPINLKAVKIPCFFASTEDDHIAPWTCGFAARKAYGGPVTFILSGSGHIAGIFNEPAQNKYHYWSSTSATTEPEEWLASAEKHPGTWWPVWFDWIQAIAGPKVPSVKPGDRTPILEDAPGSYVMVSDIY